MKRDLVPLFLVVFVDLLGFGIIMPLLPFLALEFDASPVQIGLLATTYSFFQFVASPVLGYLSDRFGRKKILVISQLGSALGFGLLAFAPSLSIVFLARIIDGITGGNISVAQAYIADVTKKENRARGMGILSAAFGLGFILGPALGGVLAKNGFMLPGLVAAVVASMAAILTAVLLKETVPKRPSFKKVGAVRLNVWPRLKHMLQKPPVRLFLAAFFVINLSQSLMQAVFPLWAEDRLGYGPGNVGMFFAYIGIWSVFVQVAILPQVLKKVSEKRAITLALFVWSLGFLGIPFARTIFALWAIMPLISLGSGVGVPIVQSLTSQASKDQTQGETMGVLQSVGSLGRIFGPVIGAEVFQLVGASVPFFLASLLFFLLCVLLAQNFNKNN